MHQHIRGAAVFQEVDDEIEDLRVNDVRSFEVFARRRRTRQNEDAGTDDRADAQRRQRPRSKSLLQAMFRVLRFGDQLVDGLAGKQLTGQRSAPIVRRMRGLAQ